MRRSAPVLAGLLLLAAGYAAFDQYQRDVRLQQPMRQHPPPDAPNILLVVLDATRADHLGAYGYRRDTSPNIDRFARHGVLFENAYSSSSWTLPSHASLFTNLYPFQNGVDPWFLAPQFRTLAEVLTDHHYARGAAVGNTYWCNYPTGIAQGFQYNGDYFHNLPDAVSRTLYGRKAMEAVLHLAGYYRNPAKKTADTVNEEILAWLDARPAGQKQFFAFLNYYDAHEPCFPPAPFDSRFAPAERIRSREPLDTHAALPDPVPPERLQADIDAYDSSLAYVDAQLGALWAELDRRGLADNTLLIVTSDHGHSFGEGGVYGHRTSLRREQIHVPLLFYWKGRLPEGVRVAAPVSQIHVPATVTDLAGLSAAFAGHSLAAHWRDPGAAPAEPVLAQLAHPRQDVPEAWPIARGDMRALLTERWQYIEWGDGTAELFDLAQDPGALHNLAASESPRVLDELRGRLARLLARSDLATALPVKSGREPASRPRASALPESRR